MLFGYFAGIIPLGIVTVPTALLMIAYTVRPKRTHVTAWEVLSPGVHDWGMVRALFLFILLPIGLGAAADHYQWVDLSGLGNFTAHVLLRSKGGI
jgi:hypothetical protein